MLCSSCGAVNPAGSRFCMSCGSPLDAAPEPVDGPHTIVSNVGAAPVMCTCAMARWPVRYAPTSPPPRTMRRKPGSISGANARSYTGTRESWVGFTLRTTTRLCAISS